jgi:RNA polymerase sigma-70 factor (ECF subfamily)
VQSDRRELERIYCQCYQELFSCALVVTSSPTAAEDAVHEAFSRLLTNCPCPDDLKAYVFRAVRNAAVDQVRRAKKGANPLLDFIFDPSPSPTKQMETSELVRRIADAMQRVSSDERETIVQHLYGSLTFQQIALVRDAPLGTVTGWYRRGLTKLRRELEASDGRV